MVAAGDYHAACVTSDGNVYTWGMEMKIIGRRVSTPTIMYGKPHLPAVMVSCGASFTMILDVGGTVYTCGCGLHANSGELGREFSTALRSIDSAFFGGAPVGMIAAGDTHSMAVGRDSGTGTLWTWGNNRQGQLGHGTYGIVCVPTRVEDKVLQDAGGVVTIAAGCDFSMAVTKDGVAWACGSGECGELGLGTFNNHNTFQRVGCPECFGGSGVRMVSCGFAHTLFVAKDNSVWGCGTCKMLGMNAETDASDDLVLWPIRLERINDDTQHFDTNDVIVVAAGVFHSIAVSTAGLLYTWGEKPDMWSANGLGYVSAEMVCPPQVVPMPPGVTGGIRFGRWHEVVPCDNKLTFAMTAHERVGSDSAWHGMPPELMRKIFDVERTFFSPAAGTSQGVVDMLGSGST